MRWLSVFVVVLALCVVAVGCGGSDESASGDTTLTETTTTDETTTDTAEETTDETDVSSILGDEDCLALASAGAAFAQAVAGTASTEESTDALDELASKVPDEIRSDVELLAQGFADYAAEVEDIGIDAGATPSAEQLEQLKAATLSFGSQPGLAAAMQRLDAWTQENCPSG